MIKNISIFCISLLISLTAVADHSICFDDQNAFVSSAPKGWVADYKKGKELGLCVLYYLKGSTFDSSPAVLYPNLVQSNNSSAKIKEIVEINSQRLREKKSDITIQSKPSQKNKHGLLFENRHFLEGPSPQEYEAVAYHAAKGNSVLMAVLSTRSKNDFEKHKSSLTEFVETVRPISRNELDKFKKK